MATVTGSKRHLDITSDTLTTSSNVDVGAKLFITTTDTNTTSTSALVLNSTEVETRTLGSLAFSSATYDNYVSWNLKTNDTQRTTVGSGGDLNIVAGTNVGVAYSAGGTVTISSTDTTYSAGTLLDISGTTFNVDLTELTNNTAAFAPTQDHFVILDNGVQGKKLASSIFGSAAYEASNTFATASHNHAGVYVPEYEALQPTGSDREMNVWRKTHAVYSDDGGAATYFIIQTEVPQDNYSMGGFTLVYQEDYSGSGEGGEIKIYGYWNPESNGGFTGFRYECSNPYHTPTIEVCRNSSSGNTAFFISGEGGNYTQLIAKDLWLGYSASSATQQWGNGWVISQSDDKDGYTNFDTLNRNDFAAITTNGSTPSLTGGVSAAEVRTLIGAQVAGSYLTAHPSITEAADVNNSGGTVIQDLTFDDNGHVTATGSVNLDNIYTSTDGTENDYRFKLNLSNFSGTRWYKVATVNVGSGGLRIRGMMTNHVESFGSNMIDLAIQGREGNNNNEIEVTGHVHVLHQNAGIAIYSGEKPGSYLHWDVYVVATQYTQCQLDLTQMGGGFDTSGNYVATEPSGTLELETYQLSEGNYVIRDSAAKRIFDEGINLAGGLSYTPSTNTLTQTDNNTEYSVATTSANGLMSSTDKTKLDGVEASANNYSFILEDGDGTEVSITNGKEVKFVEGTGININWTDTSTGSDSDPYDLTFNIKDNSIGATQINVSGNGSSGQVLTSDGDGTMSWTNKTTNTDTITSVGVSGTEVTGTVTLTGAGATSLTQTGNTIEIRSTDTQYNDATTSTAGLMSTTDKTKLDGIESGADVTDSTNVATAGALMATGGILSGTVKVTGSIIYENDTDSGYIPFPKGAQYQTKTNSHTGAIKITLPTHGGDDMIKWVVDIYDYSTGESVTMFMGGYVYQATGGNEWVSCTVTTLTEHSNKDYTVRFGADGTNSCVWIGETNSTWAYPQVIVRDFVGGFITDIDAYDDDWSISFVTSFDTVDETISDNLPTADWDRIEGKPTEFTPASHTHSAATTSANGFMSSGDKTKLDGIETSADVTDATNVAAAGALMTSGGTITGDLTVNGKFGIAGVVDREEWGRSYAVSNTNIQNLLDSAGNGIADGGAYRVVGHIDGTGTDQASSAVFWNQNGTWYVNVTGQSGTSSNHIQFLVNGGKPAVKTYHANDYTVRVSHERLALEEGTGTDNARYYFGADSYMSDIAGTLKFQGTHNIWHAGNSEAFTTADHTKLDGIASGAEVNVQADWNETTTTSDAFIKNKPTLGTASASAATDFVAVTGDSMSGALGITYNGIGLDVENSATSGADTGIRIRGARNGQSYSTNNLTSYILLSNYDDNTTPNSYDLVKIGGGMYDASADTGYLRIETNNGTALTKALDIDKNQDAKFYGDIDADGNITGSNLNVSNWDTAYGWGNHASAEYAAGDHSHSAATTSADGFMSSADKTKLDGVATGADVTPSWVPASDPSYLTSLPSHDHNGLYYTEGEMQHFMARALGWVSGYGNASTSYVNYNFTEDAIELSGSGDSSTGAVFKAIRVKSGDKVRFTIMLKGTVASDAGLYLRLYQHNGNMPDGKTHVSNSAGASEIVVQEDDSGDTGWEENRAVPNVWTNYEHTYTAPADGYVSLVVLNWTGHGQETIYLRQPDIQFEKVGDASRLGGEAASSYLTGIAANSVGISELNVTDGTSGQVLTTNGSGTLSFSTVTSGGSDTNYYLSGIARTDSTNTLVFTVTGATNQSFTFGSNAFTSYTDHTSAGYLTEETYTAHEDTSNLSGTYGSTANGTKIDEITVDANGHITSITTGATGNMTGFFVEDGDGTEVQINNSNEWKFVEGGGIDINWTDTTPGSDADPYDLTFTLDSDLRGDVVYIGGNSNNYIQFDTTNNNIDFYAGGAHVARMEADGDLHIKGDVIAFSDIFE